MDKLSDLDVDRIKTIIENAPFEAVAWNEKTAVYSPIIRQQDLQDVNNGWISMAFIHFFIAALECINRDFDGDFLLLETHLAELDRQIRATATEPTAQHRLLDAYYALCVKVFLL